MPNTKSKALLTLLRRDDRKIGRAVLITGPWGSGKTFLWKKEVEPQLNRPVVYVSAFGAESAPAFKSRLLTKFLFAVIPSDAATSILGSNSILAGLKKLFVGRKASAFTSVLDSVAGSFLRKIDLDPIELADLLPPDTVVCIDDIERTSPNFKVEDLLAIVNILAEHKSLDVVLICDEDKISATSKEGFFKYKEKAISTEIHVQANVREVFDWVLEDTVAQDSIRQRIKLHKEVILGVFQRSKNQNIRSLARAFTHLNLAIVVGGAIPTDSQVRFLTAITLCTAEGNRDPAEFYEFNDWAARISAAMDRKNKQPPTEVELKRFAFVDSYFGEEDYTFHRGLFQLIRRGDVNPGELQPPVEAELSAPKKLLKEIGEGAWRYSGDAHVRDLITRIASAVRIGESLSARDTLELLAVARFFASLLGETVPADLTPAAVASLTKRAREGDVSVGEHFRQSGDIVERVAAELEMFEDTRLETKHQGLASAARGFIASGDKRALVELLSTPDLEGLKAFVSKVGIPLLLGVRKVNPGLFQAAASAIKSQLQKFGDPWPEGATFVKAIDAEMKRVADDPTEDAMDRWRARGFIRPGTYL